MYNKYIIKLNKNTCYLIILENLGMDSAVDRFVKFN